MAAGRSKSNVLRRPTEPATTVVATEPMIGCFEHLALEKL